MSGQIARIVRLLTVCVLMFSGCADQPRANWTLEQKIEHGRKAAIAAVVSPKAWVDVHAKRLSHGSCKIDTKQVRHRMYQAEMDTVSYHQGESLITYTIPTGLRFGMHSTFIDVTMRCATGDIVAMSEYFYP